MKGAGGNRDRAGETAHRDRHRRPAGHRRVAQLSIRVVAPALRRTVAEQRARMVVAGSESDGIRDPGYGDRRRRHLTERAVAALSFLAETPTARGAVGEERAAELVTRDHRCRSGEAADGAGRGGALGGAV